MRFIVFTKLLTNRYGGQIAIPVQLAPMEQPVLVDAAPVRHH
ncbi:hypothetical protein [Paraburkholderia susongensis]|nr:hypothetical protein [Paraburkholderia susongensis]